MPPISANVYSSILAQRDQKYPVDPVSDSNPLRTIRSIRRVQNLERSVPHIRKSTARTKELLDCLKRHNTRHTRTLQTIVHKCVCVSEQVVGYHSPSRIRPDGLYPRMRI